MANIAWKANWKTNFSFLKLKMGVFNAMNNVRDSLGRGSEVETKAAIDKGLRALRPATIESRLAGKYWGKERGEIYKTSDKTPLKHTGALYKSIKWNKNTQSLEMNKYGRHQDSGFTAGRGITVRGRPFIKELSAKTARGKIIRENFFKSINKSMKTRKF